MKRMLPDFTNKLVSVSFAGADDTHAIEHPRWETQGGRLFLVGTIPRGGSTRDWCEGVECAVAWDEISDYLLFDSVEGYRARLRVYHGRKGKT